MILTHQHRFIHGCDCCCCDDALLLDLFPDAAAAYSVRKLSSTYLGSAMQVRRDSDSTTLDIGFVGQDLDTASLLAFAGAGSAFVSIWYDQSGFGRNATASTLGFQPRVVNTGVVVTEFTKPAVSFAIDNARRLIVPAASLTLPSPQTIATVSKLTAVTGLDASVIFDSHDNVNHLLYNTGTTDATNNRWVSGAGTSLQAATPTTASQALFFSLFNGASSSLHINGVSTLSGNMGTNALTGLSIGQIRGNPNPIALQYDLNGRVQEMVIYPTNQSANRAAIESNINAYYSIY